MLTAKLIRDSAQLPITAFLPTVFLSVLEGYAVDDEMVVQSRRAFDVGCHDDLKAVAPHSLGCQYTDLVAFLWCKLSRLEALISVISNDAAALAVSLLGCRHSFKGKMG